EGYVGSAADFLRCAGLQRQRLRFPPDFGEGRARFPFRLRTSHGHAQGAPRVSCWASAKTAPMAAFQIEADWIFSPDREQSRVPRLRQLPGDIVLPFCNGLGPFTGRESMKTRLGMLLLASTSMIVPAAAQQGQPNPNQVAAKAILQAADAAIGASK